MMKHMLPFLCIWTFNCWNTYVKMRVHISDSDSRLLYDMWRNLIRHDLNYMCELGAEEKKT